VGTPVQEEVLVDTGVTLGALEACHGSQLGVRGRTSSQGEK